MQVNITLLFQACNFFIAWFLLHKFYFKPAISSLDAQEKKHDAMLSQKNVWHEYVSVKQQDIHTGWRKLKQFARHHLPEEGLPVPPVLRVQLEEPFEQAAQEPPIVGPVHATLVQELKDTIIAEVLRVEV